PIIERAIKRIELLHVTGINPGFPGYHRLFPLSSVKLGMTRPIAKGYFSSQNKVFYPNPMKKVNRKIPGWGRGWEPRSIRGRGAGAPAERPGCLQKHVGEGLLPLWRTGNRCNSTPGNLQL